MTQGKEVGITLCDFCTKYGDIVKDPKFLNCIPSSTRGRFGERSDGGGLEFDPVPIANCEIRKSILADKPPPIRIHISFKFRR